MSFTPWDPFEKLREAEKRGRGERVLVNRFDLRRALMAVDVAASAKLVGCAAKGCDRVNQVALASLGLDGKSYCSDHSHTVVGQRRRAELRALVRSWFRS